MSKALAQRRSRLTFIRFPMPGFRAVRASFGGALSAA